LLDIYLKEKKKKKKTFPTAWAIFWSLNFNTGLSTSDGLKLDSGNASKPAGCIKLQEFIAQSIITA
jgi:hypothetical protein